MTRLKHREKLAIALIIVATLFAIWSAIPDRLQNNITETPSIIQAVRSQDNILVILDNIGWLHIVVHSVVFGGVAFLVGPWGSTNERGSTLRVFLYVITATIIWEAAQAGVYTALNGIERTNFNFAWFSRVLIDFAVNIMSAGIVVIGILAYQRTTNPKIDETEASGNSTR